VIASYHLGPMDQQETQAYVEHRLKHVGWSGDPSFDPSAFDAIYSFAAGIPRRINTMCNRVLLAGYLAEKHTITAADIDAVVTEIKQEFGPDAVAPVLVGPDNARIAASVRVDSTDTVIGIEDRLGRLERTMTATIDLLHQLLHKERPEKASNKVSG